MYLEIDEGYHEHRKTLTLCGLMQNPEADTYPVRLWRWAIRSAPSGDMTGMSPYAVETILRYRLLDGKLYDALVKAGFIDVEADGTTRIHNWHQRTGAAIQRMADKAGALKQRRLHAKGCCEPELCPICTGTEPARSSDKPRLSPTCTGDDPPRQDKTSPDQSRQDKTSLKTPPKAPRGGLGVSRISYPDEFERFWAVTNQLGSKAKTLGHWERFGKPSATELIAKWKAWQQTNGWQRGFEKHPEFWFSGRMHEQDPPPPSQPRASPDRDVRVGQVRIEEGKEYPEGEQRL